MLIPKSVTIARRQSTTPITWYNGRMQRVGLPAGVISLLVIVVAALLPPTAAGETGPAAPNGDRAAIARLYFAAFDRAADLDGLNYWDEVHRGGTDLDRIADYFVASEEFSNTYGTVDQRSFVNLVYQNVLDRDADEDGLSYWVGLLDDGYSAGTILNGFAQSPEFALVTQNETLEPQGAGFPEDVLIIGDSIFHGIRLLDIPIGDAQVRFLTEEGRQVAALPGLLDGARVNGQLAEADVVVIHLGTNGWIDDYDSMFSAQVEALAPTPVFVVTTEVSRPWESKANDQIESVVSRFVHVNLIDWNQHVEGHPDWMRDDGIHPTRTGLEALAQLVTARIADVADQATN